MKNLFFAFLALVLPLAAQDAGADPTHPLLAVLPLQGQAAPAFANPADQVYQRVVQAFFLTKRFQLIERAQLEAVLGEGKLQSSGLVDDATAVSLGKQMGAKFVVVGSYNGTKSMTVDQGVSKEGRPYRYEYHPAELAVSLRMVSVENGRIQELITVKGTAKDSSEARSIGTAMSDLSRKLDREVSNRFPVTGYLIKIIDDKQALIDLGKKDGIAEKDELVVFDRAEDIVHPVTGKIIKGEKRPITEFKVVSVDEETAIVKLSGAKVPLKPGMALESKPKKRGFLEALNDTLLK
jgi:hypothetical protein